jgi:hypothetical protein
MFNPLPALHAVFIRRFRGCPDTFKDRRSSNPLRPSRPLSMPARRLMNIEIHASVNKASLIPWRKRDAASMLLWSRPGARMRLENAGMD